jgi:hypothetical protein
MNTDALRPAVLREEISVRGCRPETMLLGPRSESDAYNNMGGTACLDRKSGEQECADASCYRNWGWTPTTCTDMLPFQLHGKTMRGVFRSVSNAARATGIDVGTAFELSFVSTCAYVLTFPSSPRACEEGDFTWVRASHQSMTNSGGGDTRYARMELWPKNREGSWKSLCMADDRFTGTWQNNYGLADFTITQI